MAKDPFRADGTHAELGEDGAGQQRGRINAREVALFKSVALQDMAARVSVYRRALELGLGLTRGL
jgi:ornithine cyclodeaminase/alanine dehydrogenase-like protein (mu-crystallin family)